MAKKQSAKVDASPRLYGWGLVGLAIAWLLIGLIFIGQTFNAMGQEWNTGILIWVFGLLHFAAGVRIIGPNDFAAILVLGYPTIVVTGRLIVVPPGIFLLVLFTRQTTQNELPAEPDKIFRDEDKQAVPEGMKPPIRITFANPDPKDIKAKTVDPSDPLEQRTTNEVSIFVRWRIIEPWDFYVNIGNIDEATRQLEDTSVRFLQEKLTKMTPSQAFKSLHEINEELDNLIRKKTDSWGIQLIDASIKLIGLSRSLNTSIQAIAQSKAAKQSAIITAEGEEQKLTLEGQGRANAVQAEIDARTKGMKKMAGDLDVDEELIVGAEMARAIGQSPSEKIIIGTQGFTELVGIGKAIAGISGNRPAATPGTPGQPGAPAPAGTPGGGT